jgi:hypothetical protein
VPEGRQDQVGPAPVHGAAGERRLGLDQQDRLVPVVQEVRPELIGEQPPAGG